MKQLKASVLAASMAAMASTSVSAMVVYTNDFQASAGGEWSSSLIASAPNPDYSGTRRFLGQFGAETVSLGLAGLAAHTTATVSFDVFVIRSWDGESGDIVSGDSLGPDIFRVSANGVGALLNTTFSNGGAPGTPQSLQKYGAAGQDSCNPGYTAHPYVGVHGAMTGASECYSLGYADWSVGPSGDGDKTKPWQDAVYHITLGFAHLGADLDLNFAGINLQSIGDESWGIDNVQVETNAVPLPPAVWALAPGLLAFGVLGRRRA